jgi:hypothetical protein
MMGQLSRALLPSSFRLTGYSVNRLGDLPGAVLVIDESKSRGFA